MQKKEREEEMERKTRKKRKAKKEKKRWRRNLDDVVNVDLAVLVVVQRLSDAQQLVFWDVLDLPHDGDELIDADQVLPEGVEQTAYRKRLCDSCFDGDERRLEEDAGEEREERGRIGVSGGRGNNF